MFRHLLVPLDGSLMAESALPMAAGIAGRMHAELTFVHVIERNAPSEVHSERHLVTPREASDYLDEVSRRPICAGLVVHIHVHEAEVRDVARSITEHTAELAPDLVVMSTHGKGGARRLLSGTMAQQVIGLGATPVLLVRPDGQAAAPTGWQLILAPVDGDPAHEKGLPIAAELAAAFGCSLHLLMVTPKIGELTGSEKWTSTLLPGATRLKLEMQSAEAQDYLARTALTYGKKGVSAGAEASRGDPARAIVRTARRLAADLIVMATHGRAGTGAFWEGSVAARVVSRTRVPLLLVPLRE